MWIVFALLSIFFWGWINVLDSVIVRRYQKHPMMLMWSQSIFSVPTVVLLLLFLPVQSSWAPFLVLVGATAYVADVFFFWILDRIDVSVVNASWSIQAILLSFIGVYFFHEHWSVFQLAGGMMILCAVMLLSFWHRHISLKRTLGLLTLLAVIYIPNSVIVKLALIAGEKPLTVFLWSIVGRETLSISLPLMKGKHRREINSLFSKVDGIFFLLNALVILCFFLGVYSGTLAYASGPLSLIAIINNLLPFVVILFAWILSLWPALLPRELMTKESVRIKLISFVIAFFGLALLSFS